MTDRGTSAQALPHYLNEWVARQRWFASKGSVPVLHSIGEWSLVSNEPGVQIRTYLVFDSSGASSASAVSSAASSVIPLGIAGRTLYQLPITERTSPLPGGESALIATRSAGPESVDITPAATNSVGEAGAAEFGTAHSRRRFVYDAPHDPVYAEALLRLMLRGEASPVAMNARADAFGQSEPGTSAHAVLASRVLRGEQSNTSIIYEVVDALGRAATPIICKLFRALHPGENPDVAVQTALARAGSRLIPQPIGSVSGHWAAAEPPIASPVPSARPLQSRAQTVQGHLAFAQEFLPGVEDAWRTALTAARNGVDFSAQARSLGVATAHVHFDLARVMPCMEATSEVRAAAIAGMRQRYRAAVGEVAELAELSAAAERIFDRAETAEWPALQRIHGDYHLGQVLNVPGRGWALVDFEGEPLKPLSERVRPDVPLRDVAGMLRSFAYAASTIAMNFPEHDPAAIARWGGECRSAFLEGYACASGQDLQAQVALLDAFELDKAVYETVYETRNRPTWLAIPLAAVRTMTSAPT